MRIAIIGTRDVTKDLLVRIHKAIDTRFGSDVVVHSGGAVGVDQVAYKFNKANVFLPWATYNINERPKDNKAKFIVKGDDTRYDEMLTKLFPWFTNMTQGVKKLVRRNAFIVLGYDGVPRVDAVVWYTGKGVKGGTAYGVNIARHYGIKTIELKASNKKVVNKKEAAKAASTPQFDRDRFNKYVQLVADFRKYYEVNANMLLKLELNEKAQQLNLNIPEQVLYAIIDEVRKMNGKEYKTPIEIEVDSIIRKVEKIKEERKESAVAGSSLTKEFQVEECKEERKMRNLVEEILISLGVRHALVVPTSDWSLRFIYNDYVIEIKLTKSLLTKKLYMSLFRYDDGKTLDAHRVELADITAEELHEVIKEFINRKESASAGSSLPKDSNTNNKTELSMKGFELV